MTTDCLSVMMGGGERSVDSSAGVLTCCINTPADMQGSLIVGVGLLLVDDKFAGKHTCTDDAGTLLQLGLYDVGVFVDQVE
uniref:Uncharacterized protein n=2 Tax=unclassified Prevotella TaxID=2638335 RepID=A0AB33IZ77_9BACT